jgi:hypothetical protein
MLSRSAGAPVRLGDADPYLRDLAKHLKSAAVRTAHVVTTSKLR